MGFILVLKCFSIWIFLLQILMRPAKSTAWKTVYQPSSQPDKARCLATKQHTWPPAQPAGTQGAQWESGDSGKAMIIDWGKQRDMKEFLGIT